MGNFDKIVSKLPEFIVRNAVLNSLIGSIANSLDLYENDVSEIKAALNLDDGDAVPLDALAADYGLVRHYNDTDKIMGIRIGNSIVTYQQRGSQSGLEIEGSEISLVTPYKQPIRYIIGVDPIGTGKALGGGGSTWIHYWGDTAETETDLEEMLALVLPLHIKAGINFIDAFNASSGYMSVRGADLLDTANFTITNVGFYNNENTLIPRNPTASYNYGNIDLGADFGNFDWLADWIDYSAWDVDYSLVVQVRFSPDEAAWSSWTPYAKNQLIGDSEINRYAQFKIDLTMNEYRSLNHYIFRSFILKGLTAQQLTYGENAKGIFIQTSIGN